MAARKPPATQATTTAGTAGSPTANKITAAAAAGGPTQTEPTPTTTTPSTTSTTVTLPDAGKLKSGDTGELVTALQNALVALDLPAGTPDGTFGDATRTAVIQFQTAQGLTPDGIVGPATADKINASIPVG